MSFFSDLFEGHFDNLGRDLTDAPSSFANHPSEMIDVGLGAAALAAPFAIPELGAALGLGEGASLGADAALATDASLAADAGVTDAALTGGADALAVAPDAAGGALGESASLFLPDAASPAAFDSGVAGFNPVGETFVSPTEGALPAGATVSDVPAAAEAAGAVPGGGVSTPTPAGFANTDAELAGAATGVAPPAAAPAAPSLTSQLGGVLSSPWTKLAMGAAPLALTLGMGQPQLPSSARALQGQATQLSQQGMADLAAARAGTLNAGQTATIGAMQRDLTNSWRQALFNQGVQDPTKDARWPQIQGVIDAKVTEQTATMIQQNITNALAETGQAASALTAIANMQFQSDAIFTNALINATKALGLAAGMRSQQTIAVLG